MNQYRRIVSYLYKYDNGKKGENTGFLRLDTREEGIRLHLRIKDLRMMDERRLKMYFYFHKENRLQLVFVDEFLCIRGNCEYKKMVFPDLSDRDFEKINGVVFLDGNDLLYGSCWDEREISENLLAVETEEREEKFVAEQKGKEEKNREKSEAALPIEMEQMSESPSSIETHKLPPFGEMSQQPPVAEMSDQPLVENKETLLSNFPQIDLYHPEEAIYAVRIQIEDISILSMKDWKLADNPFLKQAYETESHLLLGIIRMPNETELWVLGVPGIYDNREKYLAGIFGFTDYIPVENSEFKTGGKGYWIRQIEDVK